MKSELDKACFQHDMLFGDFIDLPKGTASDKVLRDKAFNITFKFNLIKHLNRKYDGYQRDLASMVYKFFDGKTSGSGANNKIKQNQQLANELHKPIIKNYKKRRVYSSFKDNIWGADLADMRLISKYNKGFKFSSSVIDIFSKYP